jgi:hypothetical protein
MAQEDAFGFDNRIRGLTISKAQANGGGSIVAEIKGETEVNGLDELDENAWLYAAMDWAVFLAKGDREKLNEVSKEALARFEEAMLERTEKKTLKLVK